MLVQWSSCAPEDATWEEFSQFCEIYGFSNLEDKVVFEQGSSVSSAQFESPITLDPKGIHERLEGWIEQALHEEEPTQSSQEVNKAKTAENQPGDDGERVQARAARVRVRPRWLKEFVRMEQH